MSTTFDVWVSSGSLQRHTTSPQEVADLLSIVERDLAVRWLQEHHSHLPTK